jgi:hypothetical protein
VSGQLRSEALAMSRNSHLGVTSEEIYKEVGCATIQSLISFASRCRGRGRSHASTVARARRSTRRSNLK